MSNLEARCTKDSQAVAAIASGCRTARKTAASNEQLERRPAARRADVEVGEAARLALTAKYKTSSSRTCRTSAHAPNSNDLGQQLGETRINLSDSRSICAHGHGAGTDFEPPTSSNLEDRIWNVTVDAGDYFSSLIGTVERTFRHEADNRGLAFEVHVDPHLGRSMMTDPKRLQQVLKNLLSNAFKFTSAGGVRLNVTVAASGWTSEHPVLDSAPTVVALEVSDTGIGIPSEKQKIICEAFQQAMLERAVSMALRIGWPHRELAALFGVNPVAARAPHGSRFTSSPLRDVGPAAPT